MASKPKGASKAPAKTAEAAPKEEPFVDPRPDLAVTVDETMELRSADSTGLSEKTVVFKDTNSEWNFTHLNIDGDPWIHGEPCESKDDALAKAALAFPAWPVEVVKQNPWLPVDDAE
jgi:hypothetical protein